MTLLDLAGKRGSGLSAVDTPVSGWVVPTSEESMIARQTLAPTPMKPTFPGLKQLLLPRPNRGSAEIAAIGEDPMTVAGLERALGMLRLDAAFCERSSVNPRPATWAAGLPLSPIEVDAFSRLPRVAIARARESLDPSLRRRRQTHPGSLR